MKTAETLPMPTEPGDVLLHMRELHPSVPAACWAAADADTGVVASGPAFHAWLRSREALAYLDRLHRHLHAGYAHCHDHEREGGWL
jgi:hypothetical protein